MKDKLFLYCPNCGLFEKEVKTKSDMEYNCPLCNARPKGLKISAKKYAECEKEIEDLGISMWFGIEKMFADK